MTRSVLALAGLASYRQEKATYYARQKQERRAEQEIGLRRHPDVFVQDGRRLLDRVNETVAAERAEQPAPTLSLIRHSLIRARRQRQPVVMTIHGLSIHVFPGDTAQIVLDRWEQTWKRQQFREESRQ